MTVQVDLQGRSVFYDRFFQENYPDLQRWALQIAMYNRDLSHDLLHDVYLRVSQREDNPESIESVHAYLYKAIKNAHISHLRRKTRTGGFQISLSENESDLSQLLIVDPRLINKAHDDLRAICRFACNRKSTSISASILILRFFHGYYSAEVAKVVNRSLNAVEARLVKARREASSYLLDSVDLETVRNRSSASNPGSAFRSADLLTELREMVFASVEGRCLPVEWLRREYRLSRGGLERAELSHLVSCAECLDNANTLIRIPLLKERHPLDSIGPQTVVEILERNRSMAAAAGI